MFDKKKAREVEVEAEATFATMGLQDLAVGAPFGASTKTGLDEVLVWRGAQGVHRRSRRPVAAFQPRRLRE